MQKKFIVAALLAAVIAAVLLMTNYNHIVGYAYTKKCPPATNYNEHFAVAQNPNVDDQNPQNSDKFKEANISQHLKTHSTEGFCNNCV